MNTETLASTYPRTWARCWDRAQEIAGQTGGTMDPIHGYDRDGKLVVAFLTGLAASPMIVISRPIVEVAA